MHTKLRICLMAAMVCTFLLTTVTGCGDKSESLTNEPEITVEYLQEDYSKQLLKDGAHNFIGYVEMEKAGDGDVYLVHFGERDVVADATAENGYYIADTNVVLESTLGSEGRIICLDEGEPKITDPDTFIENQEESVDSMYSVYFMGTSAELIVEVDPATVITQ